ncbi:MAG: Gfo/Idh/MocA family oxidoreductase [Bacteroidetes bacterium]|nr:Gfo/Idh/MocA family oxidoreductase [Bacteroidota bacterium]
MKFCFGIIGCGKISIRHAENMARFGKIIAVCDIIPERANTLAAKFGANPYLDVSKMLEMETELNVIAICSPNGLHAIHSIACLNAGKDVLCEKPLCIKSGEGEEMLAAAKRNNKKLFVVKSTRFNPPVISLKNLLGNNSLGKIYSFQLSCIWNRPASYYFNSWKGTLALDGGTLYTQFSHYIDVLYWLFGEMKNAQGFRKNLAHIGLIEFEDTGAICLEMKNGIVGTLNYSVNSFNKNMEIALTVIAEKGTIKIGGEYLNELIYSEGTSLIVQADGGNLANDYGTYKGSMSNHHHVYDNFIKALSNEENVSTTAIDGLKTVEMIEKIYTHCKLIS